MKRLLASLSSVGLILAGTTTATADHPDDGTFEFLIAIDEDGDRGELENQATQVIYERELATHTLDAEAGWVDGDRKAYMCGYAFLEYRGFVVARAHIARFNPEDVAAYVGLQDKFMHEGARNFDGGPSVEGNTVDGIQPAADTGKSCPGTPAEAYDPHVGRFDAPPVVTFQHGPHAIDVRDFGDEVDVAVDDPRVHWQLFEATPTKVTIVAYHADNLPVAALYYELVDDVENDVAVGERTPGTQHPVSLHVGCGLHCVHHHEPGPTDEPDPTEEPTSEPEPDPGPAARLVCPAVNDPVVGQTVTCTYR